MFAIIWFTNSCSCISATLEQYEMSAVKVALLVKEGEDESINGLGRRMKSLWTRKKWTRQSN
jgi:hypothetical protein